MDEITWNRVMPVDDHPMWIEALDEDFTEEDPEIVAVVENETKCLQWVHATHLGVVVMDLQIPAPDGATYTKLLVQELPDTQVPVVSASGEREGMLRAMKSGAWGYLMRSASKAKLIEGVQRTAAGDAVFTPGPAGSVLGELRRVTDVVHSYDDNGLVPTTHEVEALRQVTKGLTYWEIVEKLFAPHRIVRSHIRNVLRKL